MNSKFWLSMLIVVGLAVTIVALSPAKRVEAGSAAAGALDGKKFVGQTGEKGKEADHEDVLSFSDGMFTSSACVQYGFKAAPYTATIDDDSIHFQAETTSPTHGKMLWTGTLKDGVLEVTYTWIKERWLWDTSREYWFRGTLAEQRSGDLWRQTAGPSSTMNCMHKAVIHV